MVACRSCSILKSSTVKFNRIIWCMMNSSVRYLGGGDRSTVMVSHIPLQDLRTLADVKHAPRMTSATLKITLIPSHRKQSQMRSNVSHGNVRVIAHKNQSVIWQTEIRRTYSEFARRWNHTINFFPNSKVLTGVSCTRIYYNKKSRESPNYTRNRNISIFDHFSELKENHTNICKFSSKFICVVELGPN